jgi:hypothetical protein
VTGPAAGRSVSPQEVVKLRQLVVLTVILTACVASLSVCPGEASPNRMGTEERVEPSYRTVLRSLLYPGWGQLRNSKHLKAVVFFASETALLGMIYNESREATRAYDAHLAAPDRTEAAKLYEEYEEHFERRESLIWWTAGLVLFSLVDAYIDANLITFEEEFDDAPEQSRISLKPRGRPGGGFISLEYVF